MFEFDGQSIALIGVFGIMGAMLFFNGRASKAANPRKISYAISVLFIALALGLGLFQATRDSDLSKNKREAIRQIRADGYNVCGLDYSSKQVCVLVGAYQCAHWLDIHKDSDGDWYPALQRLDNGQWINLIPPDLDSLRKACSVPAKS